MSRRKIKIGKKKKQKKTIEISPKLALENVLNIKRAERHTKDEEDIFALITEKTFDVDNIHNYKYYISRRFAALSLKSGLLTVSKPV